MKIKLYFIELNKKIKALSSTDPKAYWEILKDGYCHKNCSPDSIPSITAFSEHFKELNDGPFIPHDVETNIMECAAMKTSTELDSPITSDEILDFINNLENNKASF